MICRNPIERSHAAFRRMPKLDRCGAADNRLILLRRLVADEIPKERTGARVSQGGG
jgi:hypothetical protein